MKGLINYVVRLNSYTRAPKVPKEFITHIYLDSEDMRRFAKASYYNMFKKSKE